MVIFLKQKKFISQQSLKGPYIYDIHMKEGWGWGLKFVMCLQILLFLSKPFFVDIINIRPLNGLKLQSIQSLEACVPSSTSSQIHFEWIEINPHPSSPTLIPPSTPLMTKPNP